MKWFVITNRERKTRTFGTDHEELRIEGTSVADVVRRLVEAHDQPFSDAANIPLYLVARQLAGKSNGRAE